ncbi:DUF6662 family protein [Polynucleobacter sp. MWH-UH23A]|uniref:DUF6662 family protein n=1 Tax=Polynucleobacter sp. MWH-UH23A TaxID=1855613 RepID=UPI003364B514
MKTPKLSLKSLFFFVLFLVTLFHLSMAHAGEGAFGWIYTLDLQPKGELEFEQRLQLTKQQASGSYNAWVSRSELEYGLTNDFQIAGYLNAYYVNANQNYNNCEDSPTCTSGQPVPVGSWNPAAPYRKSGIEGGSLEAIYRITNPVTSPVGVGLYLEPTIGKNKNELEARLLLQSNFIDDKLITAANIVVANEQLKFAPSGNAPESMLDFLVGASYRFAPKWFGGVEARFHNDYSSYNLQNQTQKATFVGPNLHYASKDWWFTAAWRYQLKGGTCMGAGTAECSNARVWDSHGLNEFIVKVGFPIGKY